MFAVTATSKALAAAGIDHIVTEGGRIIVEADYDGDKMVPDIISVTKQGDTYIAKRSKKKMVPFREYQRKLMKKRREAGYAAKEAKLREKLGSKAGKVRPAQKKSAKLAWTKSPRLQKVHKQHLKLEEAKKAADKARNDAKRASKKEAASKKKTAGKKVAKVAPKAAPKKVAKPATKVKVNSAKPAAKKSSGKGRFA